MKSTRGVRAGRPAVPGGMRRGASARRGATLTEMMVAMTILTIVAIAGMSSFSFITKSIHKSRTRTLANNLVQEKMEVLKNYSYYQLLVTTHTTVDNNHGVVYDDMTYPPETIGLWGYPTFTRAVHVAYAEMAGNQISTISYSSSDTGLKLITSYLLWKDGDMYKTVMIKNLLANPSVSGMDSGLAGTATQSVGGALQGAIVEVVGNPNWTAFTDSAGAYSFSVAKGTYSITCSSQGYYQEIKTSIAAPRGSSGNANFTMVKIASGIVSGTVWISTQLVIAGMVVSSDTCNGNDPNPAVVPVPDCPAANEREWIDVYNPTTYTWTITDTTFRLWYDNKVGGAAPQDIPLTFVNTSLPSKAYYLIASTRTIQVNGVLYSADAYYTAEGSNVAIDASDGGIGIAPPGGGPGIRFWDSICWSNESGPQPPTDFKEGACAPTSTGFMDGWQAVRKTHYLSAVVDLNYASSYDTDYTTRNWCYDVQVTTPPRNTSVVRTPLVGRPAHGAMAVASDGRSSPARTTAVDYGNDQERAQFSILGVTTGTWIVTITSGAYMLEIGTVTVLQNATTYVPNATTVPAWPAADASHSILISTSSGGFIQGYVYGAGSSYSTPIKDIQVDAGGPTATSSGSGYYIINVSSGTVTVNANLNSANSSYGTDSAQVSVGLGEVAAAPDFHLGQSGLISGYVTSGTGALPNVVVKASRSGGVLYESYSDNTGYFYISVSTAGTAYTVTPVLAAGQSYATTPTDPLTGTVSGSGQVVHVGTITVTGGMGTITGKVKDDLVTDDLEKDITTGVLIIASVGAISDPPAAIYGSSAPGMAYPVYSASSQSDGSYSLEVTAGSYYMSAYYPRADPYTSTFELKRKTRTGVAVTAGNTTPDIDFTGTW
ncbi:MAG: carboxypeptidase regulatory-like domain-containing protein [Elusimicrobia bacterium]|nr:carboxypeptidase regulatory-like domain-containing protein [Elusimicrobiota bacterium]